MLTVATTDSKTEMILAKVVSTKGVEHYAMEVAKKMIELLGYRKENFRSDSEPAISGSEGGCQERERCRDSIGGCACW